MMHPLTVRGARTASVNLWFMAVAWLVIAVKCVWVWWAVGHWHLPMHPLWIVAPTLAAAALATWLWLVHRES